MATLTAPSTPIAVCGRTGMNVRVPIVPPSRGALTSVVLGTLAPDTSPRPISAPAASRSACTRAARRASAASSDGGSVPVTPRSAALATTTGMPLSTQVTSMPSMTSVIWPVGSSRPVAEPSVPANRSSTGAARPGTPAIAVSPARKAGRRGGERRRHHAARVDHADPRRGLLAAGLDQAALGRERPDPGQDVAAVLLVGDGRLGHAELEEQVVQVRLAAAGTDTTATLDASG